jgi:predicted component of type VI protein secretion system
MAFLKIMSGASAGLKFDITKDETTMGRLPESVLVLNEPAVSSRHCVIVRDGKKFTLRDVGSTNGTRLNEKKVTESRLKPKDVIVVGSVEMVFDGDDIEVDLAAVPKVDETAAPKVDQSVPPAVGQTAIIMPTTTPKRTVVTMAPANAGQGPTLGAGSPFNKRREHKALWAILIVIMAMLVLAALACFLYQWRKMEHGG